MSRAMRTAASGMQAQQMQVDTIANNIANVNTAGFKKNQLCLSFVDLPDLARAGSSDLGEPEQSHRSPGRKWVGNLELDQAVHARRPGADRQIRSTSGSQVRASLRSKPLVVDTAYTRDGSFRKRFRWLAGHRRRFPTRTGDHDPGRGDRYFDRSRRDGQRGDRRGIRHRLIVGQIQLTRFSNPPGLKALGGNMFCSETASSGTPTFSGAWNEQEREFCGSRSASARTSRSSTS